MTRYEHAGAAASTTLTGAVSDAATVFTVADATGWPTGSVGPFWGTVDAGGDEERVLFASRSGNTLNVQTRGADGTTAKAHAANVTVAHTFSATEADEASAHAAATTGTVHGLVLADLLDVNDLNPANVVFLTGIQTLTGKTLSVATLISPTLTGTMTATSATISGVTLLNPVGVARGTLGFAQVTANQTPITAEVDLAGLSVTVTVAAGRRIRVTAYVPASNTTTSSQDVLYLYDGGSIVEQVWSNTAPTAGVQHPQHLSVPLTPSAGSHTYKLRQTNTAGTTTMVASATEPAWILVEDIGV